FAERHGQAAGERVEAVVEGLLADQEETIRLLEGGPGACPGAEDDESHEQRENQARAQVRHTDTVRLPRPSSGAYDSAARRYPTFDLQVPVLLGNLLPWLTG